jgi:hypothetical protein
MAYRRVSEPDARGYFELAYQPVQIALSNADLSDPKWIEHPSFGRKVDIAALDVTEAISGFQIAHANEIESDAILDPFASQDVYVVGFPFGQIANAPAPIWKRGSIAIDPTYDPEGLPKMLIDTATREGMSGSVVVARHVIVGRDYLKKDGTRSQTFIYAQRDVVVGIYSGRHYPDLEKAQLGIVWKRRAIEETLAARKVVAL